MFYKQFEFEDISFAYIINSTGDSLDLNRFKKRDFNKLKDVLNLKSEAEAKSLSIKMVESLFKHIANDLIENNEIFIFPVPSFGYMKIANTANINRPDYVYNFDTEGKIFTPKISLDKSVLQRNKKHYKVRFNGSLRNKMYKLISNGHNYV